MAPWRLSQFTQFARTVRSQLQSGFSAKLSGAQTESTAQHMTDTTTNKHVNEYLSYYVALPHPPKYAVMINGPWGIGKTYLIKDFLRRTFAPTPDKPQRKAVYVSLYGLSSLAEIDSALLQAMYPLLGHKATRIAGRVAQTLMKYKGVNVDFDLTDILNKSGAEIYVFDDLERCRADLNAVLGYINEFVEHDDSKVIIIANDAEIFSTEPASRKQYDRSREKLIGKILEVQSAFAEAFKYFCSLIDNQKAKSLFEQCEKEIASIYTQSKLNNLRILQQTMWDFERFSSALTEKHWENAAALNTLLNLFFALSFELKVGQIKLDDIAARGTGMAAAVARLSRAQANREKDAIELAGEKYPEIDLRDTILSNQLLVEILAKGIVDVETVQISLNKSRFFVDPSTEPAWRTIWSWFERTDAQFQAALDKMESQFANREFVNAGEMLQVFGLRLFLSKIEILKLTREQVVAQAKAYIDDRFSGERASAPIKEHLEDWDRRSYDGLGMHENDTAEFIDLFKYLDEKNRQAVEKSYPAKAQELMQEMEADPALYYRRLCLTNSEENIYYRIPILAYIDPDVFVETVLRQHPNRQRTILMAFKTRYENDALSKELQLEREWLEKVRDKLTAHADKLPPIGRYRLLQNIEWNIAPALNDKKEEPEKKDSAGSTK